ncbi:MAG: hypothetical protein AABX51_01145 [Nanoarchaeota archaeon]
MKKDFFDANTAVVLSLGFWVPLFNIGLCGVSSFFAVKALGKIEKQSSRFGGRNRAIAALVINVSTILLTLVGVAVWAYRKIQCP